MERGRPRVVLHLVQRDADRCAGERRRASLPAPGPAEGAVPNQGVTVRGWIWRMALCRFQGRPPVSRHPWLRRAGEYRSQLDRQTQKVATIITQQTIERSRQLAGSVEASASR